MAKQKKSKMALYTRQDKIILYCGYALLGLFLLAIIVPMIYIVIASFMDPVTLQNKGISFDFSKWSLDAYQRVVSDKQIWVGFKNATLLDHLHHHLGSCDDACRLSHVAAGLQRQKDLQRLVCDHDVFQRRSDPHLPAHQQSGSAGFHVGGHSAGSIQRVEHDHCPYLLSRHPA